MPAMLFMDDISLLQDEMPSMNARTPGKIVSFAIELL